MTLDLQASNILLRIEDETFLKDCEEAKIESFSARKIIGKSAVFETRDFPGPLRRWIGAKSGPVLCDFGEARSWKYTYNLPITEHIQPAVYLSARGFLAPPVGHTRGYLKS